MGKKTGISWTNSTFIPWKGCTKVSPGCANCYAETLCKKSGDDVWGVGKSRKRTSESAWSKPLSWNASSGKNKKKHLVFCSSMSDWLDSEVPIAWVADLLLLIKNTQNLTWQLLTKRPELFKSRINDVITYVSENIPENYGLEFSWWLLDWVNGLPPENIWMGSSAEDQKRVEERIPALLLIPAKVRFLSCEPLLESVNFFRVFDPRDEVSICGFSATNTAFANIDWVIVGGESGDNAREFNLKWAREVVSQCKDANVKVFVKQMGDNPSVAGFKGFQLFESHHGANPEEWPEDLRIQEFPE